MKINKYSPLKGTAQSLGDLQKPTGKAPKRGFRRSRKDPRRRGADERMANGLVDLLKVWK